MISRLFNNIVLTSDDVTGSNDVTYCTVEKTAQVVDVPYYKVILQCL
jgi:hypothetical protein